MLWLLEMLLKDEPILDKGSCFYSVISAIIKLQIFMTPTPLITKKF